MPAVIPVSLSIPAATQLLTRANLAGVNLQEMARRILEDALEQGDEVPVAAKPSRLELSMCRGPELQRVKPKNDHSPDPTPSGSDVEQRYRDTTKKTRGRDNRKSQR